MQAGCTRMQRGPTRDPLTRTPERGGESAPSDRGHVTREPASDGDEEESDVCLFFAPIAVQGLRSRVSPGRTVADGEPARHPSDGGPVDVGAAPAAPADCDGRLQRGYCKIAKALQQPAPTKTACKAER